MTHRTRSAGRSDDDQGPRPLERAKNGQGLRAFPMAVRQYTGSIGGAINVSIQRNRSGWIRSVVEQPSLWLGVPEASRDIFGS